MIKFFVDEKNITDNIISVNDKEDVKHLSKVLRAKVGDELLISDSREWEYSAEICEIKKDEILLKILDRQRFATEPDVKVCLFQGIPKSSKMEVVIQKCVEEGVLEITPVFTSRTVVKDKNGIDNKIKRWRRISYEAVKQCKRGVIPQVKDSLNFEKMLTHLKGENYTLIICPYEDEENNTIKDILKNFKAENNVEKNQIKVALIIGPEGGFDKEEIQALKEIGAGIVTLGKTILRTETAGLVALAMIMYELEL